MNALVCASQSRPKFHICTKDFISAPQCNAWCKFRKKFQSLLAVKLAASSFLKSSLQHVTNKLFIDSAFLARSSTLIMFRYSKCFTSAPETMATKTATMPVVIVFDASEPSVRTRYALHKNQKMDTATASETTIPTGTAHHGLLLVLMLLPISKPFFKIFGWRSNRVLQPDLTKGSCQLFNNRILFSI